MQNKIKAKAKQLLTDKTVASIIGYEQGDNPELTRPVIITQPEEVDRLVWNEYCIPILSKYLLKPEVKSYPKTAIIAKSADLRAIVGLIQEKQLAREDVYIIGIGSKDKLPEIYDDLLEDNTVKDNATVSLEAEIKGLETKSSKERWSFWQKELSKCIKCYACRQVCPLCYCRQCIADKNQPQWIPTSPHFTGNFFWNITRAYHLAGRCIDCGECERACPMGIPLMLLNKKIKQIIKDKFDYVPGIDPEVSPPLATFKEDDKENFII